MKCSYYAISPKDAYKLKVLTNKFTLVISLPKVELFFLKLLLSKYFNAGFVFISINHKTYYKVPGGWYVVVSVYKPIIILSSAPLILG